MAAASKTTTWDLEPEVEDLEVYGCQLTLDWWCETIALDGNAPVDQDAIDGAEAICSDGAVDEDASNMVCVVHGYTMALLDAGNSLAETLSAGYPTFL